MLIYIVRRLLSALPVVGVVSLVVFSMLYLIPGDPAAIMAGDRATDAELERIRTSLGLDKPFLFQFGAWTLNALRGDFGVSIYTNVPVTDMILQRLEPTLSLMIFTMILSIPTAILIGVVAAHKVNQWPDRLLMMFSFFGFSVPVFVIAYLLVYIFSMRAGWFPVQGYKPIASGIGPYLISLVLPTISLSIVYISLIARMTRASMLEVLSQDFIRTARAKGANSRIVLLRHALRNSAVPIATVVGTGIALLIGGAVVTETVFAIPGVGRLTVDSILRRDLPIIQGIVFFFSISYVIINFIIDIIYIIFDPRIRY